jgi:reverse gyrase
MATKQNKTTAPAPSNNNRTEVNRKRRLERTIKAQPNNEQAKLAFKDTKSKRKAPVTPYWTHTMIREAKLFKMFTGKMDISIFSSNEVTRANTRLHLHSNNNLKVPTGKVNFTLGARAHDGQGNLVWG